MFITNQGKDNCDINALNARRDGDDCVTACFKITSSIESCISSYGYGGFDDDIGDWAFVGDRNEDCDDYFERQFEEGDEKYIGLANCVDELNDYLPDTCFNPEGDEEQFICKNAEIYECAAGVWEYVAKCTTFGYGDACSVTNTPKNQHSEVCIEQTCNTIADTNCDGTVDWAEINVAIGKWLNGEGYSWSKINEAVAAWLGG